MVSCRTHHATGLKPYPEGVASAPRSGATVWETITESVSPPPAGATQMAQGGAAERNRETSKIVDPALCFAYSAYMDRSTQIVLRRASDWKKGVTKALKQSGKSRYQFADAAASKGICTQYTASSLVAEEGTVRGKRNPALETAIALARLAGCEMVIRINGPDAKEETDDADGSGEGDADALDPQGHER